MTEKIKSTCSSAKEKGKAAGLRPMIYTHPIGYHGHGAGPTIGDLIKALKKDVYVEESLHIMQDLVKGNTAYAPQQGERKE